MILAQMWFSNGKRKRYRTRTNSHEANIHTGVLHPDDLYDDV